MQTLHRKIGWRRRVLGEARRVGRHPTTLGDARQTAGEGALLPSPAAAAVGGDRFRPNQTTRCRHHLREEPRGTATDRHRFVSSAARRPGERRTAVRAPGVRVDRPYAPYARQICARSTLYIVFFFFFFFLVQCCLKPSFASQT
ncbi:unnamed protein product [Ixodes pacificus]